MKQLLIFSLLLMTRNVSAQDTLYHPVPMLGSEKYILHDDGTFSYVSYLCGYANLAFGSYRKNVFGYSFDYDTTKCPQPTITSSNKGTTRDEIVLFFYDLVENRRMSYFGPVVIGDQVFECEEDSLVIPKKLIRSNSLVLKSIYSNVNETFTFDSTGTQLKVYLNLTAFECGINKIRKLKKTKYGYLYKFIVYDENNEKPWKKGKKRIIRNYFELRK